MFVHVNSCHVFFLPLLHTARVVAQITFLLSDSSALPITLQDYIKELRKEFDHFMAEYQEDFHKANLSLGKFQISFSDLRLYSLVWNGICSKCLCLCLKFENVFKRVIILNVAIIGKRCFYKVCLFSLV